MHSDVIDAWSDKIVDALLGPDACYAITRQAGQMSAGANPRNTRRCIAVLSVWRGFQGICEAEIIGAAIATSGGAAVP
jgi:hypothetical protein